MKKYIHSKNYKVYIIQKYWFVILLKHNKGQVLLCTFFSVSWFPLEFVGEFTSRNQRFSTCILMNPSPCWYGSKISRVQKIKVKWHIALKIFIRRKIYRMICWKLSAYIFLSKLWHAFIKATQVVFSDSFIVELKDKNNYSKLACL